MKSFTMNMVMAIACAAAVSAPALAAGMNRNHEGHMQQMAREPHHVLAMAYNDNLKTFAKTLQRPAEQSESPNAVMARAAVGEMRRSFDLMKQHCQDHMATMNDTMKAQMSTMMQQMDTKTATINARLEDLEREVSYAALDARIISSLADKIIHSCDGMSQMHRSTRSNTRGRN